MRNSCGFPVNILRGYVDKAGGYPSAFTQAVGLCLGFANFLHKHVGVFQQVFGRIINKRWDKFTELYAGFATVSTRIITNTTSFNKKGSL